MKLITVLSFLIPFALQSICSATAAAVTIEAAWPAATTTTAQSGNNFLLSDFPFMVEIKIYKNEIWLCTKFGGFISQRWIIMTSYYEDNTPYLVFEILSPDYYHPSSRYGINTTKYFPYPKLLGHDDFADNIALLDMGRCDFTTNNFMEMSDYGVTCPSTSLVYKLQKFIDDDMVNMELVKFDTTQKCHENMLELCYDDNNNFKTNASKIVYRRRRRLNKDIFFIRFDTNNSPVLIGIQIASQQQQQQQQQDQHYNKRECNRFLNIKYFWKWICAVTGINYFGRRYS